MAGFPSKPSNPFTPKTSTPAKPSAPIGIGNPKPSDPTGVYITPTGNVSHQSTNPFSGGGGGGGSSGGGGGTSAPTPVSGGSVVQTPQGGVSYAATPAQLTAQQALDKASQKINLQSDTYGKSNLLTNPLSPIGGLGTYQTIQKAGQQAIGKVASFFAGASEFTSNKINQFLNKPKYLVEQDIKRQQVTTEKIIQTANPKIEDYNKAQTDFSNKWDNKIKEVNGEKTFTGNQAEYNQYQKDYEIVQDKYRTADFIAKLANSNVNNLNKKQEAFNQKFEPALKDVGKTDTAGQALRTTATSAVAGFLSFPTMAVALVAGLASNPVKTLKNVGTGIVNLPSQYVKSPYTTIGTLAGQVAGGYVTGEALAALRGKTEVVTKVEKINPTITKSYTLQDAVKIGEENGVTKWQVNAKVITNKINPQTGSIVKTINTDVVSKVIVSQNPEGIIKVLAKADANALRSSRVYDVVSKQGLLAENKIIRTSDLYKAATKGTLQQVGEGYYGTTNTLIQKTGGAKVKITYDQLTGGKGIRIDVNRIDINTIKTRIPSTYRGLSNVAIKQIGEKYSYGKTLTNSFLEQGKVKAYIKESGKKVSAYPRTYRSNVIKFEDLNKALSRTSEQNPITFDFNPSNSQSLAFEQIKKQVAKQVASAQTQTLSSAIASIEKSKPIISRTITTSQGKQIISPQVTKGISITSLNTLTKQQSAKLVQTTTKTLNDLKYKQLDGLIGTTETNRFRTGATTNYAQLTGQATDTLQVQKVREIQLPKLLQPTPTTFKTPPTFLINPPFTPFIPIPSGRNSMQLGESTKFNPNKIYKQPKSAYTASLGSSIFGFTKNIKVKSQSDINKIIAKLNSKTYSGIEQRPLINFEMPKQKKAKPMKKINFNVFG